MSSKQQSILMGGLVAGLLSTSYLGFINMLCCAGVLLGAIVAVWHYTTTNELTVASGEGATMGLSAALIGWLVAFVLNLVLMAIGLRHDQFIAEFMLNALGDQMPIEQAEEIERQLAQEFTLGWYLKTAIASVNGMIGIAVTALFGAIGGAIGAAIFKKGEEEVAA